MPNDQRGRDRAKRSRGFFTKDLAAYPKSSDNGFLGGIDMVFDRVLPLVEATDRTYDRSSLGAYVLRVLDCLPT